MRKGGTRPARPPLDSLTVDLGERSYPIVLGSRLLEELGTRMVAAGVRPARAAVVTNPTVGALYLERVENALHHAGFDEVIPIEIPDGETHKSLTWLAFIYDKLVGAQLERSAPVVALGGGVIGDLAGFAAATFLRGVPLVQVPTTLLAQVDSSVGGKTGINHPAGKNLIGAFYQPRLVLIDVTTLATLPRREFAAGLAEVIKYGVILDAELFALLERELESILALDEPLLRRVVRRCCELKAQVVQRDERESDYRAILNFGHTAGHAVEALTGYERYLHGEAVAIGMVFAARLSRARGWCGDDVVERLAALVRRAGLPEEMPSGLSQAQLADTIQGDKKMSGGKVKFVCIEGLGRTRFEYFSGTELAAQTAA